MSKIFELGETTNSKKSTLFLSNTPINIQTFHDPKYPWIMDYAEEMRKVGNWSKNEIDLSKEKTMFDQLDESSRHIYEAGLKFAITLDSCAGRGPLQLFVQNGISANPEWECYINNHQTNEILHSESYTELVRALYNDVDDFIESIIDDEHVQKRATSILGAFDEVTKVFDQWQSNQVLADAGKEPAFDVTEDDVKVAIYKSAIVLNMFEGIRFFCTFATAWSFSEQPVKLMQGSSNIFKLIARDEMIHLDVFQKVIKILNTEPEEGFTEIAKTLEPTVYDMYKTGYQEEMDWIDHLFSKGTSLIGMNDRILKEYMNYIFAIRLTNIGLDPAKLGLKLIDNPIPWINNYLDGTEIKAAPQEQEMVGYVAAIDNSNEADFNLDDL
jgi:ribonucleotide reductase beta subunit family protein with ferritin-like domain